MTASPRSDADAGGSTDAGAPPAAAPTTDPADPVGSWWRAAGLAAIIVVVALGLVVWVPHLILDRLTGVGRSPRVALATSWFFLALVGVAWALRRLQARHVI